MSEESTNEWIQALPEPLREAPYIQKAETPEAAAQAIAAAAEWQGNSMRIPGPDATPDAMAEFRTRAAEKIPGLMPTPNLDDQDSMKLVWDKLGRPEAPDKYDLGEAKVPEKFKEFAHAANLTASQAKALADSLTTAEMDAITQSQELHTQAMGELKTEWGQAYDEKMKEISGVLKDAPETIQQQFKDGNIPADQLRWLSSLAQLGAEPENLGEDSGRRTGLALTPDEAALQLGEVTRKLHLSQSDPAFIPPGPERDALVRKQVALVAYSAGEKPPEGYELR